MGLAETLENSAYRVGGALIRPRMAFEIMKREGAGPVLPLVLAALAHFSVGTSAFWAFLRAVPEPFRNFVPVLSSALYADFIAGGFCALAALALILVLTLLVHATVGLMGGSGEFEDCLSALAYANAPFALVALSLLAGVYLPGAGFLGALGLTLLTGALSFLWGLWVAVVGVSVAYEVSTGKALIALLLVPLAVVMAVAALGVWGIVLVVVLYLAAYVLRHRGVV